MMYGMTATPEYCSSVLGAFAWAHLTLIEKLGRDLKIAVDDEPDRSLFRSTFRMGGQPLRVTVTAPYGRPDPRGPGKESTAVSFERDPSGRIVQVKGRPPASVAAIVPLDLTPTELMYHAAATRWRLNRELDRGYGEINRSVPPPDLIRAERKLLPERAATLIARAMLETLTQQLAVSIGNAWLGQRGMDEGEEVDGELVDDSFPKQDLSRLRDLVADPYEQLDVRGVPIPRETTESLPDRWQREVRERHESLFGITRDTGYRPASEPIRLTLADLLNLYDQ